MKLVPISSIAVDSGTQIRAAIDQQVVADYAEAMTNGAEFPPIVLFHDGNTHHVGDGFHRLMAAQRNQFRDVPADVRAGTQHDALWFALGANKVHGKRLTEADKRHAVILALNAWPDRSTTQIAERVGCTHPYVLRIRGQVVPSNKVPERVTGKDGKTYPSTRPRTAAEDERRAEIVKLAKDGASNAAIAEAVGGVSNSTIAKVRKELGVGSPIDKSRAAVEQRREQMRTMAASGYTSRQIAAKLGVSEEGCRTVLKKEGITVQADVVTRGSHRHDSNRILSQIVMDAENLTEGTNLIDFSDIDRTQIADWLRSLQESRDKLGAFIRKLKEQQKHGEAA